MPVTALRFALLAAVLATCGCVEGSDVECRPGDTRVCTQERAGTFEIHCVAWRKCP